VDKLDKELFQFIVFARVPDNRVKISREYFADRNCFHFVSEQEYSLSVERRQWLRNNLVQPAAPSPMQPALRPADRRALATEFWAKYLEKMSTELEGSLSSKESGGKVIKKVVTVSKSSFTTVCWEVYREILLTVMEIVLESEHQKFVQEMSSSIPAPTTRQSRGGGVANIPFDGFVMYSMNGDAVEKVVPVSTNSAEGEFNEDGLAME
jgi:hypothetical protein